MFASNPLITSGVMRYFRLPLSLIILITLYVQSAHGENYLMLLEFPNTGLKHICSVQVSVNDSIAKTTQILKVEKPTIHNQEIKIEYLIRTDSSLTLCIEHNLKGDSIVFQSYSLNGIMCINESKSDTIKVYDSNMPLYQDKRIYAGATARYFIRFPIRIELTDTFHVIQDSTLGPLSFLPISMNNLDFSEAQSTETYLSDKMTGTVAFYSSNALKNIEVYIDGEFTGVIHSAIKRNSTIPDCGEIGKHLINKRVETGIHKYLATNGKLVWEGEFHMIREGCIRIKIEK